MNYNVHKVIGNLRHVFSWQVTNKQNVLAIIRPTYEHPLPLPPKKKTCAHGDIALLVPGSLGQLIMASTSLV